MDGSKIKRRRGVLLGVILIAALALAIWPTNVISAANRGIDFFRTKWPLPFFLAMAILPMAGFPLSPFTLAAGPVFGPSMGVGNVVACAILAVVVNVTLSYWIAAKALRPLATRLARWLGYSLPEVSTKSAWDVTLLVRIIPGPPFFLQSYLLGLARVPFMIYLVISTLVPAAYMTGAIMAGDALMRGDRTALAVAGILSLAAVFAAYRLRKRFTTGGRPDQGR